MRVLKIFILLILVSPLSSLFAQNVYVLHVQGKIAFQNTDNRFLKVGDQLPMDTPLKFNNKDAKAIVISREKGKMLIDGSKSHTSDDGEFISLVKEVLFPVKTNLKMSTRQINLDGVTDLKDFFGEEEFVIIGDTVSCMVDTDHYPINNDKNMFVVRFESANGLINRRIPHDGNQLVIATDRLFDGEDLQKVDKIDIYYFDKEEKVSNKIVSFHPVLVDQGQLKNELASLKKFLVTNEVVEEDEIENELYQFVLDVYGRTDYKYFHTWAQQVGLISKS